MAGKRRKPAPRRKAKPRKPGGSRPRVREDDRRRVGAMNVVVDNQVSHHEANPGGWMPQVALPRFLRNDRTFLPLDWGEDDPSYNFDH